jgi:DNA-binding CsgD family transcriptional regulator
LVELIYQAVLEPSRWLEFVEQGRIATQSAAAFFTTRLAQRDADTLDVFENVLQLGLGYREHFHRQDPWSRGWRSKGPLDGQPITGEMFVRRRDFTRSEFFNDYCRPNGLDRMCGVMFGAGEERTDMAGATFYRSPGGEPYGGDSIALLGHLSPHLGRALELRRRVIPPAPGSETKAPVLDALNCATILLDGRGTVVMMNRAATRLLDKRDGLLLDKTGRCAASFSEDTAALRRMIERAGGKGAGGVGIGGEVIIRRPSGGRPAVMFALPLRPEGPAAAVDGRAVVALLVREPGVPAPTPPQTLAEVFGLTRAESKLAAALADGVTLPQYAERNGIGRETAHSHLKRMFAKTGAHRQLDIVRLMRAAVPPLYRPATPDES